MIKFPVLGWAPFLLLGTSLLAGYLESLTEATQNPGRGAGDAWKDTAAGGNVTGRAV